MYKNILHRINHTGLLEVSYPKQSPVSYPYKDTFEKRTAASVNQFPKPKVETSCIIGISDFYVANKITT